MYTKPDAPLSIGGIIDDGLNLTKVVYKPLFILSFISSIFSAIPNLLMGTGLEDPSPGEAMMAVVSALAILPFTLLIFIATVLIAHQGSNGQSLGIMDALKAALPKFLPMLGVLIVLSLCIGLGFIALILPGIFLMVALGFAPYIKTIETIGVMDAIKRSYNLVKDNWWRTAVVITVLMFILIVFSLIAGALAGTAIFFGDEGFGLLLLNLVIAPVVNALYLPFMTCGFLAILNDLILRKEGGDLEARMADISST